MARDRKRAKQRQRRRAQQGGQAERAPARVPGEDEIVHEAHEDDPNAAPDPLAHASAAADLAELSEAAPDAPSGALDDDEYLHADELDAGEAFAQREEAPAKRGRAAKPGGELPREGFRFVNFLRAVVAELRRVQWPDRRHVGQATGVVLGFVLIAGTYLGMLDAAFSRLMEAIL